MVALGFTTFDTALGACAVAWSERGLVGVQLPEGRLVATRTRARRRWPQAEEPPPPPDVKKACAAIVALLEGERVDLSEIALDLDGMAPFPRAVYEATRTIGPGQTRTYGEVADLVGQAGRARAVGQALGRNPLPIVVPCHRVLAAGGKPGGFSARGGVATKLQMLAIEGATAAPSPTLFAGKGEPGFDPAVAAAHLRSVDPALGRAIDRCGPLELELKTAPSTFLALAEAIVHQQLHAKAAASIFARLCALFPRSKRGITPEQVLRATDDELRSAGLSRAKLLALQDLARRTIAGEVPSLGQVHRLSDEDVIERLTVVRGIGRWTAEMFLIFHLGRPDVLPTTDYGVQQGFALVYGHAGLPTPGQLAEEGERWRPYRTAASWYLWQALEQSRQSGR